MTSSNYVILIDESGQPYIAHSVWSKAKSAASSVGSRAKSAAKSAGEGMGRGYRAATKYIEKIKDGAKTRYFYTQDELKAYYDQGKNKASAAVNSAKQKATSAYNTGRQALSTGKEKVSATYNKAIKNVSSTATKVPEYLKDTVAIRDKATGAIVRGQEAVKKIESGAKAAASKVKDKARDIAGYDELDRYEQAWDRTSEAKDRLANNPNSAYAQREVDRAEENEARAHEDYLKTPIGRINDAKSRVQEVAEEVKANLRDKIGYDEKERLEDAQKAFNEKYEEGVKLTEQREPIYRAYWDYVSELENKYGNGLSNVESKMTKSERREYEQLKDNLSNISEKWWDATVIQMNPSHIIVSPYDEPETLWDKLDVAKRDYQNTPLSKIESFRKKLKK